MTELAVYWAGRKVGRAVPQVIGRHAHPKAPPGEDPEPVTYTGIDYLALIAGPGQQDRGEQLRLANIDDAGAGPGTSPQDEDSQGQDNQGQDEQEDQR
jgi:putative transposase